jgi:hypothetical protein
MIKTAIEPELSFDYSDVFVDEGEVPLRAARGIFYAMGLSAGLWGLIATFWCMG